MQRDWDFVSWFQKLVELMEAGQIRIELRGVHLAVDDGTYWSHFAFRATDVSASGGPVMIIYDKATEDEAERKAREEDAREEAGGDG